MLFYCYSFVLFISLFSLSSLEALGLLTLVTIFVSIFDSSGSSMNLDFFFLCVDLDFELESGIGVEEGSNRDN